MSIYPLRVFYPLRALPLVMSMLVTPFAYTEASTEKSISEKGETFPRNLEAYDQRFELLGSGVFTYMIWTAYAGAYYQAEGEIEPQPLGDVPRLLELAYFHNIEAGDFAEATTKTLEKSLTLYEFNQVEQEIETINQRYQDVAPGDRYRLSWDGDTLRLALNGEVIYEGGDSETASAMFGIWLGKKPLSEDFRDALLGKE
ncbi:chalcone isomerase family protein [Halomonas vilamensis]|uniref:Chalcone isomerase family protein n=1 Tax=Vreelandella vilamensis TaxID=531309 RepID=A0ABU1H596_9GAMM|nr:chalcone isomerase family protein [Halomonas vilamensis]MDR5899290.1 chalcone isomerase family protein [Halomonas vilamensis]